MSGRRTGIRRRLGTPADRGLQAHANPAGIPDNLPLVHITATGVAKEIVVSEKLEKRRCNVFNRDLLYFFVLRPAYRLGQGDIKSDQITRFPFAFIMNPASVPRPHHVYPFDTGAAAAGIFDGDADPYVFLDDYELQPSYEAARGQIGWAFASLEAYLNGTLKPGLQASVRSFDVVAKGYLTIAAMAQSGSNNPDKRASAIEIAASHHVPLQDNVLLAIIPKQFLEDGGDENAPFIAALRTLNIEWHVYDWQPNLTPNEMNGEIMRIATGWYRKKGYL